MSCSVSPLHLGRNLDEPADAGQCECRGCGAPVVADAVECAYCGRQTVYGARRARLDNLGGGTWAKKPLQQGGVSYQNFDNRAYQWQAPLNAFVNAEWWDK